MGGGSYDGDVGTRARSTQRDVFTFRGYTGGDTEAAQNPEKRECHKDLNIKGKNRECRDSRDHPETTPIVVAFDVTRSRGDDTKVIYAKLPMFIGQAIMRNYVSHPTICFAAVGDATSGDKAPIQVGQFESDNRLDQNLAKIWLEEGGGGTGRESYELTAYFVSRHTILDANTRGKKGYLFFLGDEGFYPKVSREQVKKWIGDDLPEDIDSKQIFAELQQKYHVFLIFPQKKWNERRADIDAEMEKRVKEAGGMYDADEVDIRVSALWNNRNDLDLHLVDPCGHHIFYATHCKRNRHSPAPCGGFLDVDMNVQGYRTDEFNTDKPVENIRWPRGMAPKGHYKVYVQNYGFHERSHKGTEFRVEIQIGDEIKHFEGRTLDGLNGPASDVQVYEFDFDPSKVRDRKNDVDKYAGYNDELIKAQWADVIPLENILMCEDPKGIVDVMLGALAITEGNVDLEGYLVDMEGRGQTELRRIQTRKALAGVVGTGTELVRVDTNKIVSGGGIKRKSKSTKL